MCVSQGYGDEDYLVFDCPGQIELYNHLNVFKTFVDFLRKVGALPASAFSSFRAITLADPTSWPRGCREYRS